jgi:hypothetical protein
LLTQLLNCAEHLICLLSVSGKKAFVANADQLGMEVIGIAFVVTISNGAARRTEAQTNPTRCRVDSDSEALALALWRAITIV